MGWLDIDPAKIKHILITRQDTGHVGAVETDSDGLFRTAELYIGEVECFQVPGHTWGHLVYLIDDRYLFTGDTLWFGPDGGKSFINMLAEDNRLAVTSPAALEKKLRSRNLRPIIITGHTGWTDDLEFAFAHTEQVCNSWFKQKPHDPAAPYDGCDGRFEWTRMLAQVFQSHGLTALALAYVMEEGLPKQFYDVPIDPLEAAAMRLHDMGYEKVGLWGISKGAELALAAGSLLPGLVNAVVAVAPMNTVCQGFAKDKGVSLMPGSAWSFHGEEVPYTPFGLDKFPTGQVVWKSLKAREVTMYDLYIPLVQNPNPAAVIQVDELPHSAV